MNRENETPPFRQITDELAVPLAEIAEAVGKTYGTIAAYRNGAREPTPEVWERLATYIRKHGARLTESVAAKAEAFAQDGGHAVE